MTIALPADDEPDCGHCGVPGCPYCGRDPHTIHLVAAYLPGGCLYGAVPAYMGGDKPEFWAGLRANPPLPFALYELQAVPRDLASRLTAQGTNAQAFASGELAAAAASPFLGPRIYASPRYADAEPPGKSDALHAATGGSISAPAITTMSMPFPDVSVDTFTDPIRHFPYMDVGELAEASAIRLVYILAAFGFVAQAQPLGSSWSVCTCARDADAARDLLDRLALLSWPCKPLVAEASNAPPHFGVWTTLDSGRHARGPDDVRELLQRDMRSVFLNSLPGAPTLPDDGRVESLPTRALVVLYGIIGRADPWTAVLHRSTSGFVVTNASASEALAEAATAWIASG